MHILVVDDEAKVAAFIQQALEEEGHSVQVAYEGNSGLELATGQEFDLLILDWLLPGVAGVDICRFVRQNNINVPVLMLTARDAVSHRIEGLDAGADDYLTKPFALGELLARVRARFRGSATAASRSLQVADLYVNPFTREATRAGQRIELSDREYSLLVYMMRNAGRILSRSAILREVWGFDFDSGTNIVDVYVSYLRNKIDRSQTNKLIETVRGVGYLLKDPKGADRVHESSVR